MTETSEAISSLGAALGPEAESGPASGHTFRPIDGRLPAQPTGPQLAAELRRFGRINGLSLVETLAMAGKGIEWLRALEDVKRPAAATVARVRTLVLFEQSVLPKGAEETSLTAAPRPGADSVVAPGQPPSDEPAISAPTKRMAEILAADFVPKPVSALAEEVAREAEASSRRKAVARQIGHKSDHLLMPAPAALQAALIDDHMGAMRAVIRRWPELWVRIVEDSRKRQILPGEYFFEAVRVGLDVLAKQRRAA